MANIKFGEIDGVKENDVFVDRKHLASVGVHRPLQAGIDGNGKEGSSSIVLNGGYVDDIDLGEVIIYTGHGGNDSDTKKQIKDQSWGSSGNKGLLISEMHGLPVRIIRGANHKSQFSPKIGYKYGGLYLITEHSYVKGKDGFGICRFRLEKLSSLLIASEFNEVEEQVTESDGATSRIPTTVLRIVRDTKLSREIKKMYNYTCQVCGLRIEFNGIGYAEAAHIRPLGKPHNGMDVKGNLLCLCPNHHVMFDKGHFTINNRFELIGIEGELNVIASHKINKDCIDYHYSHFSSGNDQ
ncbi:MAG: YDG/SRA domain-containing protein [Candidatus Pedobacter colombiensis]|uniref:YDG/SRA domain-containing protein n=1 Tax=Candidatus Pedobacter colombiensis TaxID=3121371 RepID=A0AAJ6B4C1_9SPHI|nr:YDG/SRA domain-containing protein [Pedobacter sp.]WEK17432.1 MAG: YDG/SRA domain-containing protein [Pedobacter sp.]